jgi:hypothetical protein
MARKAKPGLAGQLSLLDVLERLDQGRQVGAELKAALARDLTQSRFPRDQVAARLTVLLGRSVTVAILDTWTAPSKDQHRFPLEYLPAWCEATEQLGALRSVVAACGCRLVVPDQVRRDLVQVEQERRRLQVRSRTLAAVVEAVDTGVL